MDLEHGNVEILVNFFQIRIKKTAKEFVENE